MRTFLRVHAVPGPLDYHDYSSAANGMTYKNNNNTGGLAINGQPETPAGGAVNWESVDGPQGGLSMAHSVDSDIPGLAVGTYYLDDSTPGGGVETQCTGDAQAFGNSGPDLLGNLPNTDPRSSPSNRMNSTRTIYFEAPGQANGAARAAQAASAFQFSVSSFP